MPQYITVLQAMSVIKPGQQLTNSSTDDLDYTGTVSSVSLVGDKQLVVEVKNLGYKRHNEKNYTPSPSEIGFAWELKLIMVYLEGDSLYIVQPFSTITRIQVGAEL